MIEARYNRKMLIYSEEAATKSFEQHSTPCALALLQRGVGTSWCFDHSHRKTTWRFRVETFSDHAIYTLFFSASSYTHTHTHTHRVCVIVFSKESSQHTPTWKPVRVVVSRDEKSSATADATTDYLFISLIAAQD